METPSHPPNRLRAIVHLALAIASLVGGAVAASHFHGAASLAIALAGFGGYLAFFSGALRRFGGDWDRWRAPDGEWRAGKRPSSEKNRGGAALRLAVATILSAALAQSAGAQDLGY